VHSPKYSAEKRAAIRKLFSIVNSEIKNQDMMNLFLAQIKTMRAATISGVLEEKLTAADKKALQEVWIGHRKGRPRRFQEKPMQKLNYDQMIDEIAPIVFDKYFTLDKIGEILAFYKTLARRKLLKNTTLLMTDSM
jgi:hypothetical protein